MMRFFSLIYLTIACTVQAQTVVLNDNIELQSSPTRNLISIDISKFADERPGSICGCDTEMNMIYNGQTLVVDSITADEASDWFLTQPGDVFSPATIEAGLFPVLFNVGPGPTGTGTLTVGPDDFYFGVRTGSGFTNQQPNRTHYGWVQLRPVDGLLTMVENAMAYNSLGIVVGTTIIVPEPAAIALVVLAAAFSLITRWSRMVSLAL